MGHEGRPYCERDYHEKYGVKCAYCQRFISGKVNYLLLGLHDDNDDGDDGGGGGDDDDGGGGGSEVRLLPEIHIGQGGLSPTWS